MIALVDVTIKASAIVLVALAVLRLSRRRSAAARHWVLASAVGCAAAAPLVAMAVPSWRIELAVAAPAPVEPTVAAPVAGAPARGASATPGAEVSAGRAADGSRFATSRARAADVLAWTWVGGVAANLLMLLAGFCRLAWIEARITTPVTRGRWMQIAAEVAREYGLRRPPRLLQSSDPALLVTWGIRPKVILPAGAPAWPDERIRVVLAHELAHVRRRDWLVQMGAEFLRSIHWFNPLLWIGCRRLRQESEQACDDAVLRLGIPGHSYAAHLLDLARAFRPQRHVWLPAPAIARPSSLERRVEAMLNTQADRRPIAPAAAAAILVAFVGITASVAGFEAFAQTRFATVSGTVVDQSGGVLVNATLVLSNVRTNARNEVRTDATGVYEFVGLPAGDYELEVRQPAFRTVKEPLSVSVGETLQRNMVLQIAAVQETITRTGGGDATGAAAPTVRTAPLPARRPCPNPAIGGCVVPPVKVKDVPPIYPAALSDAGIEGVVLLEANIGSDGKTNVARVIASPHPELERAAIEAVAQWEFAPTLLNGGAIETPMNISVTFKPPEAAARP